MVTTKLIRPRPKASSLHSTISSRRRAEASGKRLVALLQERYGWDAKQAELEVVQFTTRRYWDNNGPIADGRLIPEAPFNPVPPRITADVPMLIGHTLNMSYSR